MKVCLPILGDSELKKELMASDFYKAKYYCLYDVEKDETEVFSLDDSDSIYLSMSEIKKQEIQVIITPNLRPMAAKILFENEIEVYKAGGSEVGENISLYKRGFLRDFSLAMIEEPKGCASGSCSSCSSDTCN